MCPCVQTLYNHGPNNNRPIQIRAAITVDVFTALLINDFILLLSFSPYAIENSGHTEKKMVLRKLLIKLHIVRVVLYKTTASALKNLLITRVNPCRIIALANGNDMNIIDGRMTSLKRLLSISLIEILKLYNFFAFKCLIMSNNKLGKQIKILIIAKETPNKRQMKVIATIKNLANWS